MLTNRTCQTGSTYDELNKIEHIKNTERIYLSEPALSINCKEVTFDRKIQSEAKVAFDINYDDLCGPWFYLANPAHTHYDNLLVPKLCTWELISFKDITFMKEHQKDKNVILLFFKCKFSKYIFEDRYDIFPKIAWEIFELARRNSFSGKCISASIGLFFLTHQFFFTNKWCTIEEICNFFTNILILHGVLSPPTSDEIFSFDECKLLFETFCTIYVENLVLLRLVCSSNYSIKMNYNDVMVISHDEPSSSKESPTH